jgi:hypothetical protein
VEAIHFLSESDGSGVIRVLHPFAFTEKSVVGATRALAEDSLPAGDKTVKVWDIPEGASESIHPALYTHELLTQAKSFLFGGQIDRADFAYLRLQPELANHMLRRLSMQKPNLKFGLQPIAGVELFLSNFGVGLLSISFKLLGTPNTLHDLQGLAFSLSRGHEYSMPWLRIPHPSDSPETWRHISTKDRAKILPPPVRNEELEDRLGRPGGEFQLKELVDRLLLPFADYGKTDFQDQFSIYTIARLDAGAQPQFLDGEMADQLLSIAQLEETTHPGTPAGMSDVKLVMLNRNHIAAVSHMGAAHFLADQAAPADDYNDERVRRCLMKYFVPFMVATMQGLILQRIGQQTSSVARASGVERTKEVAGIRTRLLEFALEANFVLLSSRQALNRYYTLCRESLQIDRLLDGIREAVAEADSRENLVSQLRTLDAVGKNIVHVTTIQMRVERIEIIVLAVGFGEVANNMAETWKRDLQLSSFEVTLWIVIGVLFGYLLGVHFIQNYKPPADGTT